MLGMFAGFLLECTAELTPEALLKMLKISDTRLPRRRLPHLPVLLLLVAATALLITGCLPQPKSGAYHPPSAEDRDDTTASNSGSNRHLYRYREDGISPPPEEEDDEYADIWARIRDGMQLGDDDANNPQVQARLDWYSNHPKYLERVSERASLYLHHIVTETEARGMPTELALIPFVESSYNPFALSPGSAAGMWQFMPATGKHLGLQQNAWYDGRRDVVESTDAALTYLNRLNKQFDGDWLLALAAYNSGEGSVTRAIENNQRRGRPTDFWSLDLPQSTRDYIPQLLALSQLLKEPEQFDVELPDIPDTPYFTEVDIHSPMNLAQAAEMADISLHDMKQLNAGFSRSATAPNGPQRLLIPTDKADEFALQMERIPESEWIRWDSYTVKSGDSLGSIAKRFGTDIANLRSVNKLSGNLIRVNQVLQVPQPEPARSAARHPVSTALAGAQTGTYQIKSGDSLWTIARRHDLRVVDLQTWNKLKPGAALKPGQTLVVKAPGTALARSGAAATTAAAGSARQITYKVRRGDTLGRIANLHNINVSDILSWNKLGTRQLIHPGQSLTLFLPHAN